MLVSRLSMSSRTHNRRAEIAADRCYANDLPAIVAYKDAWYLSLKQFEWDTAITGARQAQSKTATAAI